MFIFLFGHVIFESALASYVHSQRICAESYAYMLHSQKVMYILNVTYVGLPHVYVTHGTRIGTTQPST